MNLIEEFQKIFECYKATAVFSFTFLMTIYGIILAPEFPVRYSFPEAVCGVLTSKLQDFWKLANAYLTGGLSSSVSHHSEKELLDILASVFNLARSLILNAVLPEALPSEVKQKFQDRLVSWPIGGADEPLHLMHVARTVRNCTAMLSQQEFTAKQIEVLHEMNIAVRYKCFNTIMERTIESNNKSIQLLNADKKLACRVYRG